MDNEESRERWTRSTHLSEGHPKAGAPGIQRQVHGKAGGPVSRGRLIQRQVPRISRGKYIKSVECRTEREEKYI